MALTEVENGLIENTFESIINRFIQLQASINEVAEDIIDGILNRL